VSSEEEAGARPATPPSLWRNEAFLKLWTGQTISLLGSQITVIALPLTAILLFRATALQVGVLGTVEFLPFLLFGLPAGVWVDRMRRRPILIWSDVGRLAALASIPVADVFGLLSMPQLYVVAFVSGSLTVLFDVAYGSYLPAVVRRDQLVDGNAKLEISRSGAQLAGPGVSGLLVQAFSAPIAILADAISYACSVASLLLIRAGEPRPLRGVTHEPMRRQIAEGLRYVGRHTLLRPLATCIAILNLFSMMGQAVLLLFAVDELGLTPGAIGLILAIGNIGFLVGAFVAQRVSGTIGLGRTLVLAPLAIGGAAVLVPLSVHGAAPALLVAFGLIGGFAAVVFNVNARSLVQSVAPEHMLGRVVATMRFVVWGTIPLGTLLGGVLGQRLGLVTTMWIAAIGGTCGFIPPLLSAVRTLPAIPAQPDQAERPLAPGGGVVTASGPLPPES
jgi:MFS family permease